MRVKRFRPRIHAEESGAVLMIVAITLVVLLGMLVLTVDLGRAIAVKRQMVNGTDAAALAAAQQCALGNSSTAASGAATTVLSQNKSGATVTSFSAPECGVRPEDPKLVTVESTVDVEYYFAGIFGFRSGPVVARSVAQWGVATAPAGAPITVDHSQLSVCGIPTDNPPTTQIHCNLEYPKDQLTNPRWGALDLSEWGDPNAAPCHVSASDLVNIINNGGSFEPLPTPNYDCFDNGLSFSVWKELEGKILLFPVNDLDRSTGTVKPGSADCTGADIPVLQSQGKDCQIDTAYIVGWIQLRVNAVSKHGPDIFLDVTYLGLTTGGTFPGSGTEDFGVRAVRLVA